MSKASKVLILIRGQLQVLLYIQVRVFSIQEVLENEIIRVLDLTSRGKYMVGNDASGLDPGYGYFVFQQWYMHGMDVVSRYCSIGPIMHRH